MRYTDPKSLSIGISILAASILAIASIILTYILELSSGIVIAIDTLLMFLVLLFLLNHSINRFIFEKIKIIYKTIHNFQVSQDLDHKSRINETLDDVNEQVVEWGKQQKQEIDDLKELAVYRREFLGNVSHELKTPIFNIQGYVLTLLDGGLDDPQINKNYLIRTEKSINRMIAIVEDLEAISQLESGTLKLNYSVFNIVELTREIIEFMEIKAKKRKAEISFDKKYDKPIMVEADKKRIRQVLINLIDNSIKYCKEDERQTTLSFYDMDTNILIEVADNGLGIDQENIPRIFERFYRTDKGRSREEGGTGLGLAIVKHIIEAHEQGIHVRSTLGVGTTFAFTLKKGK